MNKFFLAMLLLTATLTSAAQQTGSIVGTVRDNSGAVIPSATVTLINVATHFQRIIQTNSAGDYVASSLPVGGYQIKVEKEGFQKVERGGITLPTAATLTVDMDLSVGSTTQTIEVTAQVPLLQQQSGQVSNLIDSKQMVNLPLATRNFAELVLLTPGAHGGSAGNLGEGGSAYSIRGGANYSVNGSMAAGNSYLVDGLYNRNQWLNTLVMVPIVDSIAEYRVMTSNFPAEFGEAAGAVTTVTTKSGTNAFHASVWEFLRNDVLNANYFFAKRNGTARAAYRRNVFGGTIGGPVFRDRLFFFADYQGIRQSIPSVSTVTIPTPAQVNMVKTGDFSGLGIQLYNPYTATATMRQPFPNNNLSAHLDPAAVKLISLLPAPTRATATNNYTIAPSATLEDNQFDVRVDQNLGNADRLFLKYSFDKPTQISPGAIYPAAGAPIEVGKYLATGGNGYSTNVQTQSGTLGYNHVFGPNLLLEAHAGILRWYADVAPLGQQYAASNAIGISGINYSSQSGGLAAVAISGFATLGDNSTYPEQSRITTFQYDGDVVKTVVTHTVKLGATFLRHRFNGYSSFPVRGTFDFNGQFTSQPGTQQLEHRLERNRHRHASGRREPIADCPDVKNHPGRRRVHLLKSIEKEQASLETSTGSRDFPAGKRSSRPPSNESLL